SGARSLVASPFHEDRLLATVSPYLPSSRFALCGDLDGGFVVGRPDIDVANVERAAHGVGEPVGTRVRVVAAHVRDDRVDADASRHPDAHAPGDVFDPHDG